MELDLLDKKKVILKNGVEQFDLLTPAIIYNGDPVVIIDGFYLGDDMEMRADLLSQAVYGNTNNWATLLKFNGLSNPFALSKDDFILVPELGWIESQLYDPADSTTDDDIRSQYLDSGKDSPVDAKKIEYDKLVQQLYSVNPNASPAIPLPPNLAQPGETEITVGKNFIKFG